MDEGALEAGLAAVSWCGRLNREPVRACHGGEERGLRRCPSWKERSSDQVMEHGRWGEESLNEK